MPCRAWCGHRSRTHGSTSRIRAVPSAPRPTLFDLSNTLCDYAAARLRRALVPAPRYLPSGVGVDLERLVSESIAPRPRGGAHSAALLAAYAVRDRGVPQAATRWYAATTV